MDVKVFDHVVALADEGSYAKAARRLYITPQGLNNSIKRLEGSLGVALFTAAHDGVELTAYGREFYKLAKTTVGNYHDTLEAIDGLKRAESRIITLACSTGLFNVIHRDFFRAFDKVSKTDARVALSRTRVDHDCESDLLDKVCDFALLNLPVERSGMAVVPLYRDWMFVWLPEKHPLAQKESVTCADFAGIEAVCLSPSEFITSKCYVCKLEAPPLSCKLHYEDEVVAVMENAMRLHVPGFLPRQHAEAFTREGYVARPIKDIIWGFGIAYREDRELTAWDREFLDYVSQAAKFYC